MSTFSSLKSYILNGGGDATIVDEDTVKKKSSVDFVEIDLKNRQNSNNNNSDSTTYFNKKKSFLSQNATKIVAEDLNEASSSSSSSSYSKDQELASNLVNGSNGFETVPSHVESTDTPEQSLLSLCAKRRDSKPTSESLPTSKETTTTATAKHQQQRQQQHQDPDDDNDVDADLIIEKYTKDSGYAVKKHSTASLESAETMSSRLSMSSYGNIASPATSTTTTSRNSSISNFLRRSICFPTPTGFNKVKGRSVKRLSLQTPPTYASSKQASGTGTGGTAGLAKNSLKRYSAPSITSFPVNSVRPACGEVSFKYFS